MVDPSYSGFLGFRKNHPHGSSGTAGNYKHGRHNNLHQHHHAEDQDEAMSIISVATSKNFYCDASNTKHTFSKKKHNSSALSIMSDISSEDGGEYSHNQQEEYYGSNEFVIECENGEMVFVSSAQGKLIKSRCRHFRLLLATGKGGHVVIQNNHKEEQQPEQDEQEDNRILHKETWTAGTARHVIELLTEGTTWIPNDRKRFEQLTTVCEEIDVRLCLGSLINYHDLIDQASTKRFFDLIHIENFQFKFKAQIPSWQWLHLLRQGILLLAKTKVLMITVAPPTDGTMLLPSRANSPNIVSKVSPAQPNQQRLQKCDSLLSEFCVYSHHASKINALLTILDLMTKSRNDTTGKQQGKKSIKTPEQFKITYQSRIGSIEQDDLNMLWRLTSASYTLATPEERQYLQNGVGVTTVAISNRSDHTADTVPTSGGSDHEQDSSESNNSITSDEGTPAVAAKRRPANASTRSMVSAAAATTNNPMLPKYQYRTITGTSCMVLRNLFDPLNSNGSDKTLPACISVTNPTPDTLGRFLNAAASRTMIGNSIEVGFDIVSNNNETVFYVSCDSMSVKEVLAYLSNYENSAVVNDKSTNGREFCLQQFVDSA